MKLVENIDYHYEGNKMIFTKEYLLNRGCCCHKNCRNCPYKESHNNNDKRISK